MGLLWPAFLLLLTAIPLIVAVYVLALRRRRRYAVRYSSLSLIRQAMPGGFRWRRHVPFALLALALALLILALARPFADVTVASNRSTVMLALDVSLSMCADDVYPNRLTVAQEATRRFIDGQEPGTRVGLVAFAGFAQLVVPPTTEREELLETLGSLTTARATAVGSAIARSLDALSEINPNIPPLSVFVTPRGQATGTGEEYAAATRRDSAIDGRRQQPRRAAAGCRPRRPRPGSPRLHHRLRHHQPGRHALLDRPARRRRVRQPHSQGRVRHLQPGVRRQELPDAGRADPRPRRPDHRRRVLYRRERGRASRSLLHHPPPNRKEDGAHGGVGLAHRGERAAGAGGGVARAEVGAAALRGCLSGIPPTVFEEPVRRFRRAVALSRLTKR